VCCPSYLNRLANFSGRSELTPFISVPQPSIHWGTHTLIFRIRRNPCVWKRKEKQTGIWHRTAIAPLPPIAGQNLPRCFGGYLAVIYYKLIAQEVVLIHWYHYIVQSPTCFGCPEPSSEWVFFDTEEIKCYQQQLRLIQTYNIKWLKRSWICLYES